MENCSNEDSLISENPLSSVSSTINQSSRWKKLRNVIKAVSLLRNQDAVINEDIEKLVTEIKKIPTDQEYRNDRDKRNESSPYTIALNDVRRHQRFLKAVERGTPEDLKIIKEELANDPYRFLRLSNHPLSLVNKRNNSEQTPLYVACKNANYDVAKLLLDSGADHLIASKTNGEAESCLEVAAR